MTVIVFIDGKIRDLGELEDRVTGNFMILTGKRTDFQDI